MQFFVDMNTFLLSKINWSFYNVYNKTNILFFYIIHLKFIVWGALSNKMFGRTTWFFYSGCSRQYLFSFFIYWKTILLCSRRPSIIINYSEKIYTGRHEWDSRGKTKWMLACIYLWIERIIYGEWCNVILHTSQAKPWYTVNSSFFFKSTLILTMSVLHKLNVHLNNFKIT